MLSCVLYDARLLAAELTIFSYEGKDEEIKYVLLLITGAKAELPVVAEVTTAP